MTRIVKEFFDSKIVKTWREIHSSNVSTLGSSFFTLQNSELSPS